MCEEWAYFLAIRPIKDAERSRREKCSRGFDVVEPSLEPIRQVRTGGTREGTCEYML